MGSKWKPNFSQKLLLFTTSKQGALGNRELFEKNIIDPTGLALAFPFVVIFTVSTVQNRAPCLEQ